MSNVCFLVFLGRKKERKTRQSGQIVIYLALQILSKDLPKLRCQILQSGLLPNILTHQIPIGETSSPKSSGLGTKARTPFLFVLPEERSQVHPTALSFLLGAQDWEHPTRFQGLHCPPTDPSTARDHGSSPPGAGVCFKHSCTRVPDLLAMLQSSPLPRVLQFSLLPVPQLH